MSTKMSTTEALPPLPEPFDYCYEWDGPYGARKFSMASHNGRKPDRSVALFNEAQMQAYARKALSQAVPQAGGLSDAERWRFGAQHFMFPEHDGHNDYWYMPTNPSAGAYDTPEAAIDAARAGAVEGGR